MGWVGPGSYLRDKWNLVDLFVVLVGYVTLPLHPATAFCLHISAALCLSPVLAGEAVWLSVHLLGWGGVAWGRLGWVCLG